VSGIPGIHYICHYAFSFKHQILRNKIRSEPFRTISPTHTALQHITVSSHQSTCVPRPTSGKLHSSMSLLLNGDQPLHLSNTSYVLPFILSLFSESLSLRTRSGTTTGHFPFTIHARINSLKIRPVLLTSMLDIFL